MMEERQQFLRKIEQESGKKSNLFDLQSQT